MAEDDSEKRFQMIMDKLFHAPKRSSSRSVGVLSGKERVKSIHASRPELSSRGDLVEENGFRRSLVPVGSQAPLCRPWDRGDLIRRLATFKSMTWFGKPKAVSPINCACRGWVNVEMDIISCEACGARLLFSTPSSWTQQQVEKAAAVFSLKLDSGHKQLCPWSNNVCDENLALFPPTPAPTLIEGYRERSHALQQLSALPVISSLAIDYMRSPELENLLAQSSHLLYALNDVTQPSGSSGSKELVNEFESVLANLYYQALKIISLCGWEPRMLPYAVDCEDRSTQSAKDACSSETSPHFVSTQNHSIVIDSSTASDEVAGVKESPIPGEFQCDLASVILNCRLCGASVGLWAFSTVPRPLEFFKITESTEVNGQNNSPNSGTNVASQDLMNVDDSGKENRDHNCGIISTCCNGYAVSRERPSSLNLTIAGGPPPTKQKFRAMVSLPIISRHLRVGFSSISNVRNCESSNMLGTSQENAQSNLQGNNSLPCGKDDQMDGTHTEQDIRSEDVATLKRKRNDDEFCVSRGSNFNAQSILNVEVNEVENISRNESGDMSHDGGPLNEQELPSENPSQHVQSMPKILGRIDTLPEDTENTAVHAGIKAVTVSQVQECLITTPETNGSDEYGKSGETNSLMPSVDPCNQHAEDLSRADQINCRATLEDCQHASTCVTSCLEANATVGSRHNTESRKGDEGSHLQSPADAELYNQQVKRVKDTVQSSDSNGNFGAHESGNDLRLVQWDKKMEFDPVRQHRHFCPWIASADSVNMPGWKLALFALDHAKESSQAPPLDCPSTLSISEVDDPITSVRMLFMSPSEKRKRIARGSN